MYVSRQLNWLSINKEGKQSTRHNTMLTLDKELRKTKSLNTLRNDVNRTGNRCELIRNHISGGKMRTKETGTRSKTNQNTIKPTYCTRDNII